MALKEEAKSIFSQLFGPEVAKQVDRFDKPENYPKDFLDECVFFLGKLIGEDAAKRKFEPLYKKYTPGTGMQAQHAPKTRKRAVSIFDFSASFSLFKEISHNIR
ncbi:MAG: hypothetical protein MUP55_02630 [Candidatus Aenigmarchaeota archaeon]|nr:hypothetical protein [Candidatus Aenigmarchaeota archaeon]